MNWDNFKKMTARQRLEWEFKYSTDENGPILLLFFLMIFKVKVVLSALALGILAWLNVTQNKPVEEITKNLLLASEILQYEVIIALAFSTLYVIYVLWKSYQESKWLKAEGLK